MTFEVGDIVDVVERALPAGYPAPTAGGVTRREFIEQVAQAIICGDL